MFNRDLYCLFSEDEPSTNQEENQDTAALPKNNQSLDLSWSDISVKNLVQINLINNTALTALNLSGNPFIKRDAYLTLANALILNHTLQSLILSECVIDDNGILAIADAISKNHALTFLDLSQTIIKTDGMLALKQAMVLREPNPLKRFVDSKQPGLHVTIDFPSLKKLCLFNTNNNHALKIQLQNADKIPTDLRSEAEIADKTKGIKIKFTS